MSKKLMWIRASEILALFILFPLAYAFLFPSAPLFFVLIVTSLLCLIALCLDPSFDRRHLWHNGYGNWRVIFLRFFLFAALAIAAVYLFRPDLLFHLLREQPELMVLIFFFYPVFSAIPQEIIFRVFFFHRYSALFGNAYLLIAVNSILFAFAHIIFENWYAIAATFFMSILIGHTYQRSGSLLAASLEHSLYGNFIYLLGVGEFFYKVS